MAYLDFNSDIFVPDPSDEDMLRIYQICKKDLVIPEKRSLEACFIRKPLPSSKIPEVRLRSYFQEHYKEDGRTFVQVKEEIIKIIAQEQEQSLKNEISHMIEDGSSKELRLVADRFKSNISEYNNLTYLSLGKNENFSSCKDNIFSTDQGEIGELITTNNHFIVWKSYTNCSF